MRRAVAAGTAADGAAPAPAPGRDDAEGLTGNTKIVFESQRKRALNHSARHTDSDFSALSAAPLMARQEAGIG
jgi:hypothetical protein